MSWSFYIEDYELNIQDVNSLSITEAKESKFRSRANIDGDIVVYGVDYTYLKTLENTRRYELFTFKALQSGNVRYQGVLSITDIEFDDDNKTASFTPTLDDEYTAIQEKLKSDVNCLDGLLSGTVKADRYSYITYFGGFFRKDDSDEPEGCTKIWEDIESLNYTYAGENIAANFEGIYRVYAQERIVASKYFNNSHSGWIEIDEIDDKISLWGKAPSALTIPSSTELFTVSHKHYTTADEKSGILTPKLVGLYQFDDYNDAYSSLYPSIGIRFEDDFDTNILDLINSSEWTVLQSDKFSLYHLRGGVFHIEVSNTIAIKTVAVNYSNNIYTESYPAYALKDVLQNVLTQAIPDFSGQIKSKLLFNDEDESGIVTNPPYTRLDWNYVTEQLLNNYYLIQNGDFIDPYASNLTTNQQANLSDILDAITAIFNADWYIDNDGNLRIEHVVYKESDEGIDISNKPTLNKKYTYNADDIPNRVSVAFGEARYDDFTEKSISYENIPAVSGSDEKLESIGISFLATDIDGINRYLGALQNDGFMLVEVDSSGNVVTGTGAYSGDTDLQNVNLSIANLLYNYYRYEMYASECEINDKSAIALSLKKVKLQPEVVFVHNVKPNINETITTNIGIGDIESIEYKCNEDDGYTLKILYD